MEPILLVLFCMLNACVSAQTINKQGQYKIGQHVYTVSKTKIGDHLLVEDNFSVISRRVSKPKALTHLEGVKFSGKENITGAFVKMIGLERIKELLPENNLVIYLYLATNGKVEAVQYLLGGSHTKLTLNEINRLTNYIKKNITVDIPTDIDDNALLAPIHQSIKFRSLIK